MLKPYHLYLITFGIFGIINAELGVVGLLPQISEQYGISASQAGNLVSLFALIIGVFGPFMTLLFSGVNYKKMMVVILGIFVVSSILSAFAPNYTVLLIVRIIPAFLHPVYFSVAFIVAANSVSKGEGAKAAAKVFMGITFGMVFGIPITSFISDVLSLEAAHLFTGAINLVALIGILLLFPSLPVKERLSYSAQLGILKRPQVLLSMVTNGLILASMYALYSYFAEYMGQVTLLSGKGISGMLILFGAAGIIGNLIAGKLFSRNLVKPALLYPFLAAAIYLLVYYLGAFAAPMVAVVVVWGVIFTIGLNLSQNWLTSVAKDAPEFGNGLFVSMTNLGITLGTYLGGLFITGLGTQQVVWSSIIFLALAFLSIVLRISLYDTKRKSQHA